MLLRQGLLPAIEQLGIRHISLCGSHVRLRGGNIRARLRNLFRTAAGQEPRNHLLLRRHRGLVFRHRILKALLHQLGDKLARTDGAAFIDQQFVDPLAVIEGQLYLANIDVAIERDGVAGSMFPLEPAPRKEARSKKQDQNCQNRNAFLDRNHGYSPSKTAVLPTLKDCFRAKY